MPTKVKFIYPHKQGTNEFKAGDFAKLSNDLAKRLIEKGKCVRYAGKTAQEDLVAQTKKNKLADKIESYPTNAKGIIQKLKTETDPEILDHFINDDRDTVQKAAQLRKTKI